MYQATLPPEQAIGHILRHNLADARGHKAFAKGHRLAEADLPRLHGLGVERLRVAVLEPGDVHEDEAARRLAAAVCGPGIAATAPASSRVNLLAEARSVVHIDVERLLQINQIDGLTIATLPSFALARAGKRIATIKIIPFAVEEQALAAAEAIGRAGAPVVALAPLRPALYHLFGNRRRFGRVVLLYGTRSPEDILFRRELEAWRRRLDITIEVTVDRAFGDWRGHVGVVTQRQLTIRGVGKRPVLRAGGKSADNRAILVIRDGDVRIEGSPWRSPKRERESSNQHIGDFKFVQ
mgnify:CR=1 FL=1